MRVPLTKNMQQGLTCGVVMKRIAYSGATVPDSHRLPRTARLPFYEDWRQSKANENPPSYAQLRLFSLEIILLTHAATRAMKTARFPTGDERKAWRPLKDCTYLLWRVSCVGQSRKGRARDREAVDERSAYEVDAVFDDLDYGRWRGLSIRDISANEPEGIAAWLADPHACPHGGESIAMLSARVEQALERLKRDGANRVVVTHAIVVKAAVALITARPFDSVFKMDIVPLSCTSRARYSIIAHHGRSNCRLNFAHRCRLQVSITLSRRRSS
ncbi:Phosphoglycerate mutase family [Candidatus Burkholderia brachyanthoides]|nr:Phosphoglycerate mutase family [Candidatus Burkholderia brachyanthoides]